MVAVRGEWKRSTRGEIRIRKDRLALHALLLCLPSLSPPPPPPHPFVTGNGKRVVKAKKGGEKGRRGVPRSIDRF